MFKNKDKSQEIRIAEQDTLQHLQELNPDTKLGILKDEILADIVVNSVHPVDIRYINCGALRWYNSAYLKQVYQWGLRIEDVKNWESIGKAGIFNIEEHLIRQEMIMSQIKLEQQLPNPRERITHEAFNFPNMKDREAEPIYMYQTFLPKERIIITEFVKIKEFLDSIPNYLIKQLKTIVCCNGECGCGCEQ